MTKPLVPRFAPRAHELEVTEPCAVCGDMPARRRFFAHDAMLCGECARRYAIGGVLDAVLGKLLP